ncbi:MAG: putative toxin-antitoxin system toxin component, PIN family [Euryarchaeota archaeon]|nr:putative toxin-antitoxin system toxin component, PIN family [Euryarchaeota archaeon]
MKVVLDTNVLISGLFWRGNEAEVVKKCQLRVLENCTTREIIEEFLRVISSPKFELSEGDVERAYQMVSAFSSMVNPKRGFRVVEEDPTDNKFLDCAIEARAKYIISGDEHLLTLGSFKGVRIVNASEFLQRAASRRR